MCKLSEADTADAELSEISMRSATNLASVVCSCGELGSFLLLVNHCLFCHFDESSLSLHKRSAHQCQQLFRFFVCVCGCNEVDIHTPYLVDLIVLNLREDQLFLNTGGVIASAIERIRVDASEVTNPGECNVEQLVYEFVHLFAAQRYLYADFFARQITGF